MSWSISVLKNTLRFKSHVTAEQLKDWLDSNGHAVYPDKVVDGYKIDFDHDAMEHMDYLHEDEVQKILNDGYAEGDVCFGSLEGDNSGQFWGYRFTPGEQAKDLNGRISWEIAPDLTGKVFAFTGTLSMKRHEAEILVEMRGGTVGSLTAKTNYLVVGDKPGSKLKKAIDLGVSILGEQSFLELVGG